MQHDLSLRPRGIADASTAPIIAYRVGEKATVTIKRGSSDGGRGCIGVGGGGVGRFRRGGGDGGISAQPLMRDAVPEVESAVRPRCQERRGVHRVELDVVDGVDVGVPDLVARVTRDLSVAAKCKVGAPAGRKKS